MKSLGQFTDGEPIPPTSETTFKPMSAAAAASNAVKTINESVKGLTPPDVREKVEAIVNGVSEPLPMDDNDPFAEIPVYGHELPNCEACYAKGVIEALRAKSPKLAALIDAMEAQERAAHELGI